MSVGDRLRRVFADVFGIDPASIGEDSSTETIESWDSVSHLGLILAIESEFGVQFEIEDIPELVSLLVITDRLSARAVE